MALALRGGALQTRRYVMLLSYHCPLLGLIISADFENFQSLHGCHLPLRRTSNMSGTTVSRKLQIVQHLVTSGVISDGRKQIIKNHKY